MALVMDSHAVDGGVMATDVTEAHLACLMFRKGIGPTPDRSFDRCGASDLAAILPSRPSGEDRASQGVCVNPSARPSARQGPEPR